jgi:hypothetical protein
VTDLAPVDPHRLIAALEAAGFERVGGRTGMYSRHRWPRSYPPRSLMVPLDPTMADYQDMLGAVLAELEYAVQLGGQASAVLDALNRTTNGARP